MFGKFEPVIATESGRGSYCFSDPTRRPRSNRCSARCHERDDLRDRAAHGRAERHGEAALRTAGARDQERDLAR
jgi:hypothetical protein